ERSVPCAASIEAERELVQVVLEVRPAQSIVDAEASALKVNTVLARIIQENNLTRTTLGAAVITAAAVDDVSAWCILAVVVGIVQSGSSAGASAVVGLAVAYTALAIFLVRPVLRHVLPPCPA